MKRKRPSRMTLSQLQVLIAVAEYYSFSEAALQLEMSQSAVSNAIATLESDLGIVLFSRGRHGAHPTPVGERMVVHAQQMMQIQQEMLQEANQAKGLRGGQVRITSFRSVTTHILPSVIARFRQRFPEISLSILERLDDANIEEDLRKGRADVGFVDRLITNEFEAWELLQDEYVVLLPTSFQPKGADLSWEQLSTYPLIMAAEGDKHDEAVYAHCAAFGVSIHVAYHVGSDSSITSMVAQGLGATIMPRLPAEPIPPDVQVYSLPVPLFRTIWTATLANALLPPSVFAFLETLRDEVVQG